MLDDKYVSEGKEGVLPRYVLQILTLIEEAGYEAYVVGGAVRDIALGLAPHDFDVPASGMSTWRADTARSLQSLPKAMSR